MAYSDDLTSYCGLYCTGCDFHKSKAAEQIKALRERLTSSGTSDQMRESSAEEHALGHFQRLENAIEGLTDDSRGCAGCRQGEGIKDCKVRTCATDRGYQTCLDCIRMETCTELKQRPWALPALREIRDQGYESWLKTKREMIEAGWRYLDDSNI